MENESYGQVGSNLLERQVIRLITFVIALISMASSLQLFISYTITHYDSWIQQIIVSPSIATIVILTPFFCGLVLFIGKITRRRAVIMNGLFCIWVYNLGMALLNGVAYVFQGTPFMLHIGIGLVALILHGYYKQREEDSPIAAAYPEDDEPII